MQTLEKYVLDAEQAFEERAFVEGKELLENALYEEPTYAKAHNHLGWLYLFHLNDYRAAEKHLKLALKYDSSYGASYQHMATLLFDAKRLEDHEDLLYRSRNVVGVSNAFIYNDLGRNYEVRGKYRKAMRFYRLGIRWSIDEQEILVMKDNIRRCRDKRWMFLFR